MTAPELTPAPLGWVVQVAPIGTVDSSPLWFVASGYSTSAAADTDVRQLRRHRKKKGQTARVRQITALWP